MAALTAIDDVRMIRWLEDFANYRAPISTERIRRWLAQFQPHHMDLAARVLDAVDFYRTDRIAVAYQASLTRIPGWDPDYSKRPGVWRFSAMSQSAGESGDSMLHQFRKANNLAHEKFNGLFISPSRIVGERLGGNDTLVLLDDFVGSGNQVCDAWRDAFSELVAGIGNVYLILVAAFQRGKQRIEAETALRVICAKEFTAADNIFADACAHFSAQDKRSFLAYCTKAWKSKPQGYGSCGLVVVFAHGCPNNSVAALHKKSKQWTPLFP